MTRIHGLQGRITDPAETLNIMSPEADADAEVTHPVSTQNPKTMAATVEEGSAGSKSLTCPGTTQLQS